VPIHPMARLDCKRRRFSAAPALLTVGALALTLAACGGGSPKTPSSNSSKSASTSSSGSSSTKASTTAYSACLKQHGASFNIPRGGFRPGAGGPPGGGSGGPPGGGAGGSFPRGATGASGFAGGNSKFAKAFAACASLRPKGSSFGGRGALNSTAFTAYRNCLKLHGFSFPSGATGASGATGTFNRSNPKLKAALSACAPLRPGSTGASGSTSGSS